MNRFFEKMSVIRVLKHFLHGKSFVEVVTPISRKDQGGLIPRVALSTGGALRDSHELQLRYLLSHYPSIYEIGSCFRKEKEPSYKNSIEFLLMELYTSKYNLNDLMFMLKDFIKIYKPNAEFETISINKHLHMDLGDDRFCISQEDLIEKLKGIFHNNQFSHDWDYVEEYIKQYIQPLSEGKIVFFTEFPECTCSYAQILQGNVLSRFELFADGLEIANGYDDECSAERFIERNREFPIFSKEEEAIACALKSGSLPSQSAGLGIGIERLCMFLFDSRDIGDFSFPSKNF